ncbi:hypothetical protein Pelo_17822 [Pelomyxa schiedti]|nr:hypothetical protein Pelo_17822 [Pelomyxa schiedti]
MSTAPTHSHTTCSVSNAASDEAADRASSDKSTDNTSSNISDLHKLLTEFMETVVSGGAGTVAAALQAFTCVITVTSPAGPAATGDEDALGPTSKKSKIVLPGHLKAILDTALTAEASTHRQLLSLSNIEALLPNSAEQLAPQDNMQLRVYSIPSQTRDGITFILTLVGANYQDVAPIATEADTTLDAPQSAQCVLTIPSSAVALSFKATPEVSTLKTGPGILLSIKVGLSTGSVPTTPGSSVVNKNCRLKVEICSSCSDNSRSVTLKTGSWEELYRYTAGNTRIQTCHAMWFHCSCTLYSQP